MSLVGRGWDRFRDLPKGPKVLARTKERTPSPDHPAQETMSEILHAFLVFKQNLFFFFWYAESVYKLAGFKPCGSVREESVGDPSLIPGLGRSPGEGKGYLLQYSGLENSMHCILHGSQRVGHD